MEYYPDYFDEMLKIARNIGAEYLILGQHFILSEHPSGIGAGGPTDNAEHLRIYVDEVIEAMKSGVFTYVAHPDLMCFTGSDEVYEREITRLAIVSKEYYIPLEINLHGINHGRHYPSDRFFAIAGEIGCPVTFGYDAHESSALLNSSPIARATEMVKKHKLNYIGMPKLITIK
jgi:histidinol-phosphatase (PHP family)